MARQMRVIDKDVPLSPFEGCPTCPKCLSRRSGRHHIGGYSDVPEHLVITCDSCGYQWNSECADAGGAEIEDADGEAEEAISPTQARVGKLVCEWVADYNCKPFGLKEWARRIRKGLGVDLITAAVLLERIAEGLEDE